MAPAKPELDVAIIGGGPAGSAMGAYLGKAGLKCAIFERELMPRPHVGESLVPSSTRVFKELGFLDKMHEAGFPKKYGAVWTSHLRRPAYTHQWEGLAEDTNAAIRFEEREQPGVDLNYTFHVDRGKFDLMLLQHAQELGAQVYAGVRVQGVDFDDPARVTVKFTVGGQEHGVAARMVVDASGRHTLLGNQLKLKVKDAVFDQYAIHTWFEDLDRISVIKDPKLEAYIYVHFLPLTNSWIWQIPITDRITSIGLVTQKANLPKTKEAMHTFFWESLGSRPELLAAIKQAKQVRPFKEEGDYSYAMKQICGDRFVMIGDAARFVDPIFSTGVSIALNSARFASGDIIAGLQADKLDRSAFKTFESTILRGTQNWYDFISVYYRLNVLFTHFINAKEHRLDVLKLLQGDVYDEEPPAVLKLMRDQVAQIENDPMHAWHPLLKEVVGKAFRPAFGDHP